ncbi:MAG TPA: hypothetical protein VNB22_11265 [Pyrinomonadaceae bacterium]|jgi:hypothetical protein|nr:hypothetical protein [Pyrinomonadaceae bacterium]
MDNTEFSSTENLCGNSGEKVEGFCSTPPPPTPMPTPSPSSTAATVATAPLELHVCMGLNACKGHDRFGTNSCAGTGFCSTAAIHHCRTLNDCRGQGGCGLYGTAEDDATPGANECAWQGACAVPIQAERFSTQGENKGKSVWVLARKLFEERMKKANRTFGDSPYKCGPPQAWLIESLGSYDSCGSAGNKYCTFGFNNPAKDARELCEKSLHPVLCGAPQETVETNNCSTKSESAEPSGDAPNES